MAFPNNFIWGASTASYQIEGGITEHNKGLSIWDTFSHIPGAIKESDNGDFACDSYHRWREDVQLMSEIGLKSYRFSIAWTRVFPNGTGEVNRAGLEHYIRFVDALLEAGIEPCITLYHWDLPLALQEIGGWLNENTAKMFAEYAAVVVTALRGKAKRYVTFNEIQCVVGHGYGTGMHAPGWKLSQEAQFTAWHNIIYAHCLAAKTMREIDPNIEIGVASTGRVCCPVSDGEEDISAARIATFSLYDGDWTFAQTACLDPLALGHWPRVEGANLARSIGMIPSHQITLLPDGRLDFIGLNLYQGSYVKMGLSGPKNCPFPTGFSRTAIKWPITPECLEWGARFVGERYGLPMYITENGCSCNDHPYLDGKVHDAERIDFLARYLAALKRGIDAGADVRGYYHWSLLDNFEWAEGYAERFGLIYVDYTTGERIAKDSARWYAQVIRSNGEIISDLAKKG